MGFANFFGHSSTSVKSTSKAESDTSSVSSNTSRANSFPPFTPNELGPLSPATSTTYTDIGSPSKEDMKSFLIPSSSMMETTTPIKDIPSYQSPYAKPPPVKQPYNPDEALLDIPPISHALELFLQSKMLESEEFCHTNDQEKERLYFATGYGLIQCVKALMSYDDDVSLPILGDILSTYPVVKGPPGWNYPHKTWQPYRRPTSQETSLPWIPTRGLCCLFLA